MKIAIIGAGAMGLLYGGYLSQQNEVYMVCTNQDKADAINTNGIKIQEKDDSIKTYHPKAVVDTTSIDTMDIVILFVKARASEQALTSHKHLLKPPTTLLTLQNGAGHEELLSKFVTPEQLAIGISQEGSLLKSPYEVRHTGSGLTYFGKPNGNTETLANFENACIQCGFNAKKSSDIQFFVWEKLMINASSSALSGALQKEQGYCFTDSHAWSLIQSLVKEIVNVAVAEGLTFDYPTQIKRLEKHLTENPEGVPSICVDLQLGTPTEVDTISGSVVRAGKRLGIPTPTHQVLVQLIHAMENRLSK